MNDDQGGGIVIGSVSGNFSLQAGGDIVAGNKTIINQFQRIAKELTATPYKFLASYEIADSDIFYGRDTVIEELAAQVGRHKVILINAVSGAGKTSLVNAGLIPRVAENGYAYVAFREYSDPLAQLQACFDKEHSPQPTQLPAKIADGRLLQLIRGFGASKIVIFLDQFERFFVRVAEDKRRAFVAAFNDCLQQSEAKDLCFVLAFRREFFGQLTAEFEEQIPGFLNEAYRIDLKPLSKAEAREAILRPLESTSLRIQYDEDFVDNILLAGLAEQTGGSTDIDPPHLQIVCNELFEAARRRLQTRTSVLINRALYDELGGAQTILNTYLDNVVEDVAQDPARIAVVHSILKTMIDTGSNTRSFVAIEGFKRALPDVNEAEILRFIEKLLDRRVVEERKPAFSLSHEHMVGKVKEWFDQRELQRKSAEETLNSGLIEWKKSGALLNRDQVEDIRKWLPGLATEEQKLLQESENRYHEEEQKEASRRKLKKISLYGAAVFVVTVVILGTFSFVQMKKAVAARDEAQLQQTRAVSLLARQVTERGDATTGELAVLAVMPVQPHIAVAAMTLLDAWLSNRETATMIGHTRRVTSASFSAHGKRVVTASDDHTVRVWDAETGHQIAALGEGGLTSASLTLDGTRVATTSDDHTARVWDLSGAKPVPKDLDMVGIIRASISPDGKRVVTTSRDQTVRVWDAQTGHQIAVLSGQAGKVNSASFSPDGTRVVTTSDDQTARVWDAQSGHQIAVLSGQTGKVFSASFSPDGTRVVTAGWDGTARVWDAQTGHQIAVLSGHKNVVDSAMFSPDGAHVVTASWDDTARVWDAQTGRQIAVLSGHTGVVNGASFSPDGTRVVTASNDDTARVWDAQTGRQIAVLSGHTDGVRSASFSPDGTHVVTASNDDTARVWDLSRAPRVATVLNGHGDGLNSVSFSPDGTRVVTASNNSTAVWDAKDGHRIALVSGHTATGEKWCGCRDGTRVFSPDGKQVVTAFGDNMAAVWDAKDGHQIALLKGHTARVNSVSFSPDGTRVVTASDDEAARVWDASSGHQIAVLKGHTARVTSARFSPDGTRVVTASDDGTARVWDARAGHQIDNLPGGNPITTASFSPDGTRVVVAAYGAQVWDLSGAVGPVQLPHPATVFSARFSPDGTRVVTAGWDGTARVWDAKDGHQIALLSVTPRGSYTARVTSASFSPDDKRVVTADWEDDKAWVWDLSDAVPVATALNGHTNGLTTASFSPDGKRVVTASDDGTAIIYPVPPDGELLRRARGSVTRCLTTNQREELGLPPATATPDADRDRVRPPPCEVAGHF